MIFIKFNIKKRKLHVQAYVYGADIQGVCTIRDKVGY